MIITVRHGWRSGLNAGACAIETLGTWPKERSRAQMLKRIIRRAIDAADQVLRFRGLMLEEDGMMRAGDHAIQWPRVVANVTTTNGDLHPLVLATK